MKTPTQNLPASGRSAVAVSSISASAKPRQAAEGGSRYNVKPVDQRDKPERKDGARLARFAAKRTAAKLLRYADAKLGKRIADCCYVAHGEKVTLSSVQHSSGEVSSLWSGLVTCKNVWSCPVCSARIADERRAELNALLAWARQAGKACLMLTLTHRHNCRDKLASNLEAMKGAAKRMRQSKSWRALPLVGNVVATEVTHGRNGWHCHAHILLIANGPEADALAAVEGLRAEWSRSLAANGLTGNQHAFQVQAATAAGSYVAKFGAGEELALGHVKQGRNGSRTPWQLLADARDGDAQAGAMFVEYALAFKGRRQLVWSRGLKALAGVEAAVEAQAEAEAAQRSEPVPVRSWPGSSEHWQQARRRRVALTDAIEAGQCVDRAEFGPTDAERWRESLAGSQVVDDEPGKVPFPASRGAPAVLQGF